MSEKCHCPLSANWLKFCSVPWLATLCTSLAGPQALPCLLLTLLPLFPSSLVSSSLSCPSLFVSVSSCCPNTFISLCVLVCFAVYFSLCLSQCLCYLPLSPALPLVVSIAQFLFLILVSVSFLSLSQPLFPSLRHSLSSFTAF